MSHEGHSHGISLSEDADARRLARGLGLIVSFMVAEIVAGILAHSLALLSDAAHMLTDAGALLLVLAALIVYGAIQRLVTPPSPSGLTILIVAAVGIVVNLLATRELARADRSSLNIEGSFQHLVTDLFAFLATAAAGALILVTGFARADGIAALAVAAITLRAAVQLLRASGRVLLEMAPARVSVDEVGLVMASYPNVAEVHDLHVWEIGSGFPALSAHVLVAAEADCHLVRRELESLLAERFAIDHTTLQVDHAREELIQISGAERQSH